MEAVKSPAEVTVPVLEVEILPLVVTLSPAVEGVIELGPVDRFQ